MARRAVPLLVAVLAVAAVALPGCLEPHRPRVDPAVLRRDLPWVEGLGPAAGSGLDPHRVETNYTHKGRGGPPYPAILQVFGIRELGRRSTADLLELAQGLVEGAMERVGIRDAHATREGARTLRNGLDTDWFSHEGTVSQSGALFKDDVKVRIIGEVGYDGRSSTSIVAVGIAQVASKQCTLLGTCQYVEDFRSWTSMVGDPDGSVRGAVSPNGLIHNLVTHG